MHEHGNEINDDAKTREEERVEVESESGKAGKKRKLELCEIALVLEGTAVLTGIICSFSFYILYFEFMLFVLFFMFLWTFAAPVAGVISGIVSVCTHERTKKNIICSTVAIALPIVVIVTLILLFSTGVLYIRFM